MKILRITVTVDAFGLASGGGWTWYDDHGAKLSIQVPPYGLLENRLVPEVAAELAESAMREASRQLQLF